MWLYKYLIKTNSKPNSTMNKHLYHYDVGMLGCQFLKDIHCHDMTSAKKANLRLQVRHIT